MATFIKQLLANYLFLQLVKKENGLEKLSFIATNNWVVCVCLYSSTYWFLPAAGRLWHTWEVRINDLLLWVFLEASAKFHHLYFWIYNISPSKTKTPVDRLLERKWYDITFALKKIIYIDIGYKSAHYKNRQWRKDTKDEEVTLI